MTKILVIDDEKDFVELIKHYLELQGFKVCTASDGDIALDVFKKEKPEIVITDIIMPYCDGIEVICNFKKKYPNPTFKIIAISGGGSINGVEYLSFAKKLGADAILDKPIKFNFLLKKIRELICDLNLRVSSL